MTDDAWRTFFRICARVLGHGETLASHSQSWCAWTTFGSLREALHYWSAGLPAESELAASGINDGGTWGQPFLYQSLAHVIVPREFYWERQTPAGFEHGVRQQNLKVLSRQLAEAGIVHRLTELVLEVKLY